MTDECLEILSITVNYCRNLSFLTIEIEKKKLVLGSIEGDELDIFAPTRLLTSPLKLIGLGAQFLVAYNIWTDKLIKFHPILMVRLIAPGQTVGTFSIWLLGSENLLKLCFPNSKKKPSCGTELEVTVPKVN